jgi:hypothetical protein
MTANPKQQMTPLGLLFFLIALGASIYVLFAEKWPASLFTDLQTKIFDG